LEESVLDQDAVEGVLMSALDAATSDNKADALEAVVQQSEALVGQSLERIQQSHTAPILQSSSLSWPCSVVPANRAAQLRWKIEKPATAEESAAFEAQEKLYSVLLCGMAGVLKQQAVALKGNMSKRSDQLAAWERLFQITDEVLPCSEVRAAMSSELLCLKLMMYHLDSKRACSNEMQQSVLAHHHAYGGGALTWSVLNKNMFAKEVIDAALRTWQEPVIVPLQAHVEPLVSDGACYRLAEQQSLGHSISLGSRITLLSAKQTRIRLLLRGLNATSWPRISRLRHLT